MLKIIYEFLCRLHLSMRNIGKDQGSFLLFWEVNLFSEKMASQTQYSLVRWWQCSPKISDITRKCECLLIFFSFPEIDMLMHDPPLVSLRQIVKIHKYKKVVDTEPSVVVNIQSRLFWYINEFYITAREKRRSVLLPKPASDLVRLC